MRGDLTLIIETWDAMKPKYPRKRGRMCEPMETDEHGMVEYDKVGINECDKYYDKQ